MAFASCSVYPGRNRPGIACRYDLTAGMDKIFLVSRFERFLVIELFGDLLAYPAIFDKQSEVGYLLGIQLPASAVLAAHGLVFRAVAGHAEQDDKCPGLPGRHAVDFRWDIDASAHIIGSYFDYIPTGSFSRCDRS